MKKTNRLRSIIVYIKIIAIIYYYSDGEVKKCITLFYDFEDDYVT